MVVVVVVVVMTMMMIARKQRQIEGSATLKQTRHVQARNDCDLVISKRGRCLAL